MTIKQIFSKLGIDTKEVQVGFYKKPQPEKKTPKGVKLK